MVRIFRRVPEQGFTSLHFAAREGELEIARLLLAAGMDVNIRSQPDPTVKGRGPTYTATISAGSTPLLVATVRGQVPLALFLLEHGADPNVEDAGFTALHWAAGTWENDLANPVFGFTDPMSGIPERQAKLQLVKSLLARGANPNARLTKPPPGFPGGYAEPIGATPFFLAAAVADVEMMRLLLAAGADPAMTTKSNTTPLMAAAAVNRKLSESAVTEEQSLEAVKLLLELGADARAISANGENVLFGSAYRGWNTLIQLLVEKGADVNAVSKAGITPWLAASGLGDRFGGVLFNTETAALLVKLGADPTLGKPCQAQSEMSMKSFTMTHLGRWHAGFWVPVRLPVPGSGSGSGFGVPVTTLYQATRTRNSEPEPEPRHPEPGTWNRSSRLLRATLVTQYCITCHNDKLKTANLILNRADAEQVFNSMETWEKVIVQLRSRAMPPPGSRRPDNATYDAVASWLETELDRAAAARPNPGRPADLHRLNRTEYANAVRDLLGVEIDGTLILPPDEQSQGFDTNADALSVVPALLDRYLTAAGKISRLAIGDPTVRPGFERYAAVRNNTSERTQLWQTERLGEEFPLGSRGGIAARHYFPVDGEYVLRVLLETDDRRSDPWAQRAECDRYSYRRCPRRTVQGWRGSRRSRGRGAHARRQTRSTQAILRLLRATHSRCAFR